MGTTGGNKADKPEAFEWTMGENGKINRPNESEIRKILRKCFKKQKEK